MLCAISGEPPQVPVASRKSGNIFEKRLIESYISENGVDPVNGEELTVEDLIDLKSARVVRPRPPTQTSIPALLSTFQNEWDALALESFALKQQLAQTRQELSTALYDYEGALRLIAKITKERDDARDALSKVGLNGQGAGSNGDAMQLDGQALPEEFMAKIDATQKKLSSGRRKRPIPKGWSTANDIEEFEAEEPSWTPPEAFAPSACTALVETDSILYGGANGTAFIHSNDGSTADVVIKCDGKITDGLFWEDKAVFSLSNGSVNIYEDGKQVASHSVHAGPATGLALHPCGDVLASVGSDKSYILYDLTKPNAGPLSRVFADSELTCCQFHPDGHIFAAGGKDGDVKIFDIKTGEIAANFQTEGTVQALSFSENGYWLASASLGSTDVTIWDLRKAGDAAKAKSIEFGAAVSSVAWDYTAQYLAIVGGGAIAVHHFHKSSKKWTELLKKAMNVRKVAWDPSGQHLVVGGESGVLELRKPAR